MHDRIPPRLCDLSDVCKTTGLGKTTVKNLIYTGELDSIKVGRRRLIPVESIDKFIAARLSRADECMRRQYPKKNTTDARLAALRTEHRGGRRP